MCLCLDLYACLLARVCARACMCMCMCVCVPCIVIAILLLNSQTMKRMSFTHQLLAATSNREDVSIPHCNKPLDLSRSDISMSGQGYSLAENEWEGSCTLPYSSASLPLIFSASLATILALHITISVMCIVPEKTSAANDCIACTHGHSVPGGCVCDAYVFRSVCVHQKVCGWHIEALHFRFGKGGGGG